MNSPGFGPIEVEENVPSSKKVREILEEMTEDDALNKVLEKHNWQVGKVIGNKRETILVKFAFVG